MVSTLEPVNVVLANLYLIMLLQNGFNWNSADCNTASNFFQLAFILIMLLRIIAQEAYLNRAISLKAFKAVMLISSGCFLTGLGVYQSITLSWHAN